MFSSVSFHLQKFRPRCLVKFFCNERSRSTLLDPKIMFWCVSFRSGAFWTISLLHETGCKTSQTGAINAKFHATISRLNFSQRTLPIHTIGPKTHVLVRFFPFECILKQFRYCTKLGAKHAKLVQLLPKFVQRCLVRFFRNERSWSAPLDPKLIFWCISFRLGAFGTISLLHETRCKMGQLGAINARVRATKSHQNFSKRTLPIHTIGP